MWETCERMECSMWVLANKLLSRWADMLIVSQGSEG